MGTDALNRRFGRGTVAIRTRRSERYMAAVADAPRAPNSLLHHGVADLALVRA